MGGVVNPGAVAIILADAALCGITLQAQAGRLRFRPRSAMTPDLADRIKANRSALLALLSGPGADTTPTVEGVTVPDDAEPGVSSVVSVSERGRALWSEDELAVLARSGTTPADLALVSAVKGAFADWPGGGATVVSIEAAYGRGGWTRRRVAELIRDARRRNSNEAVAIRDAWRERLAVCTIDGGLSQDIAEKVALGELRKYFTLGENIDMMISMPIYDELRKAIAASEKSRYQIWQETGISQSQLCDFMAEAKGLSVEALERLADCLDLEITTRTARRKATKQRDG